MPHQFKTREDYGGSVQIAGVGTAMPRAGRGIPLDAAADRMPELQRTVTDEETGQQTQVPLTGSELVETASRWADTIQGLTVAEFSDAEAAALERVPEPVPDDPVQAAVEGYERLYGPAPPPPEGPPEPSGTTVAEAEASAGIPLSDRTPSVESINALSGDALDQAVRDANIHGRSSMGPDEKRAALLEHHGLADKEGDR